MFGAFLSFSLFLPFLLLFICLGQLEIFAFAVILSVLFLFICPVPLEILAFALQVFHSHSHSHSRMDGWMNEYMEA